MAATLLRSCRGHYEDIWESENQKRAEEGQEKTEGDVEDRRPNEQVWETIGGMRR